MSININNLKPFITPEETILFNGLEIKVKKYINEVQRVNIAKQIANTIFDTSLGEDSEFNNKDLKNVFLVASITKLYTDIDCGDFTGYVDICEISLTSGLYDAILHSISSTEIEMFKVAVDYYIDLKKHELLMNKLDEVKAESLEVQLSKFLQLVLEKIPTDKKLLSFIKSAKKELNGFDLNKYPQIQEVLKAFNEKDIPNPEKLNTTLDTMKDFVSKKQK